MINKKKKLAITDGEDKLSKDGLGLEIKKEYLYFLFGSFERKFLNTRAQWGGYEIGVC